MKARQRRKVKRRHKKAEFRAKNKELIKLGKKK